MRRQPRVRKVVRIALENSRRTAAAKSLSASPVERRIAASESMTLERRHRFLRGPKKLAVSRAEALKPAFNWVVNWLFAGQSPNHIGLVVSFSFSTSFANAWYRMDISGPLVLHE